MANFFIGDKPKFAINLQADDFLMDKDPFSIRIVHPKGFIECSKDEGVSVDGKLHIYREPALDDSSDSDSSDVDTGTWYCCVDTSDFGKGEMKVVATAIIIDPNAPDGARTEIATAVYGTGSFAA